VRGLPAEADHPGRDSAWPPADRSTDRPAGRPADPPFGVGEWSPGSVAEDATPTVRTRRRRRLRWFFGGFGAVVLLIAAGLAAWAVADGKPDPGPSPTGRATGKATGGPSRTPPLGGFALPGCLALLPDRGRCPDGLECYGPLTKDRGVASAESVSCSGRHTWEAFALGELSASADPRKAESDNGVRELCSEGSFRVISLRLEKGWRFDVLPPSREAFDSGDRTYRCLAGRGDDKMDGPTLTRRGG